MNRELRDAGGPAGAGWEKLEVNDVEYKDDCTYQRAGGWKLWCKLGFHRWGWVNPEKIKMICRRCDKMATVTPLVITVTKNI
jgi:hypothetical protein